jgi:hypothetical protein
MQEVDMDTLKEKIATQSRALQSRSMISRLTGSPLANRAKETLKNPPFSAIFC